MKVAIIGSDHTELSENMIKAKMGDTVTVVRIDKEPDIVVKVDSESKEVNTYNYEMVSKEYHPAPGISKKYQPKGHERKYKYHR